jgi:hypothetical protein
VVDSHRHKRKELVLPYCDSGTGRVPTTVDPGPDTFMFSLVIVVTISEILRNLTR